MAVSKVLPATVAPAVAGAVPVPAGETGMAPSSIGAVTKSGALWTRPLVESVAVRALVPPDDCWWCIICSGASGIVATPICSAAATRSLRSDVLPRGVSTAGGAGGAPSGPTAFKLVPPARAAAVAVPDVEEVLRAG